MRKVLAKKTQPRRKKPSAKKRGKHREIEPTAHVIKRKTKKTAAKSKPTGMKGTTGVRRTSKVAASRSTNSSRKAKTVGRAVGKALGRAIGTVERALTRALTMTEPVNK